MPLLAASVSALVVLSFHPALPLCALVAELVHSQTDPALLVLLCVQFLAALIGFAHFPEAAGSPVSIPFSNLQI